VGEKRFLKLDDTHDGRERHIDVVFYYAWRKAICGLN